jgi:rubrerythrin
MASSEIEVEIDVTEELLLNRTGIMTNPDLSAELISGAKKTVPSSKGGAERMKDNRAAYVKDALTIGSPPPVLAQKTEKIQAEEALDQMTGPLPVLLDKLGERLAFERQGTRLYEALLQKLEALAPIEGDGTPSHGELQHICEEELEHFKLLQKSIAELGGDATVQTPSADVAGVLSHGVMQIVTDPRTTLAQSLQAVLTAELADNDGWQLLEKLAAQLGQSELKEKCRTAMQREQEHLENVRAWLSAMTLEEVALGRELDASGEIGGAENEEMAKPRLKKKSKTSRPRSSKGKKTKRK